MISIESLVKAYGAVRALDGLSLQVPRGVVYGFLGPNGAGKTTTMRIVSGLAKTDTGTVVVGDIPVRPGGEDHRKLIGVLPEEPAFYGYMTAAEYLSDFVAPLHRITGKDAKVRARDLLERVGLKQAGKRRIQGFSRGMRQRLGLAAALIHRPPVLLLDEPVSALDPAGRKEVLDLIEELRGETTILLSTHILADVERVCDVVGIVKSGKLILQDERAALLDRYAVPVFEVEAEGQWDGWASVAQGLPLVREVTVKERIARLTVTDLAAAQPAVLRSLSEAGVVVRRFEVVHPSLEEIFLRLTGGEA
jgi:ABC-2 type transport system ATP-binding protein